MKTLNEKQVTIDFHFGNIYLIRHENGITELKEENGITELKEKNGITELKENRNFEDFFSAANPEMKAAATAFTMLLHSLFTAGVDFRKQSIQMEIRQAMENIIREYED